MRHRGIAAMLLVAVLACAGAADKPAEKKKDDGQKKDPPACMHCGATCGLRPICVCKPGTKKQPKFEFDVTCEPICIPGCSSHVWPFGGREARVGCTSCCEEPCSCPGKVRYCKKIKKETIDEEKPTIERKVAYVCRVCSGAGQARCCGVDSPQQRAAWWWQPPWWWPRDASSSPTGPR